MLLSILFNNIDRHDCYKIYLSFLLFCWLPFTLFFIAVSMSQIVFLSSSSTLLTMICMSVWNQLDISICFVMIKQNISKIDVYETLMLPVPHISRICLTLTFHLLTWISIGIIYSSWAIYLPSLKCMRWGVIELLDTQVVNWGEGATGRPTNIPTSA